MRLPIEIVIYGALCGLIFGGFCFAVGYIKGRFDRRSERAIVITDEEVAAIRGFFESREMKESEEQVKR